MKTIAIMPVRNESWIIQKNLSTLNMFCDAIIVSDQASTDATSKICRRFSKVLYIRNNDPRWSPENRRQAALTAAREFYGNNFVLAVDADEILTGTVITDPEWKRAIESIEPGTSLLLQWLNLWKNPHYFRQDVSVWSDRWVHFGFRDDRVTNYAEGNWHEPRVPQKFMERSIRFDRVKVLHYQFVAWDRALSKQAYNRAVELIRDPDTSPDLINNRYIITKDERKIVLEKVNPEWIQPWLSAGINLDTFETPQLSWHDVEVLHLFKEYGEEYFADIDIWDIDWEQKRQYAVGRGYQGIFTNPIQDPRSAGQKTYQQYLNRHFVSPWWAPNLRMRRRFIIFLASIGITGESLKKFRFLNN